MLKPAGTSGDPWKAVGALTSLAFLVMLAAGVAAGVRLLLAAWRNRRVPELWIGLSTLLPSVAGLLDKLSLRLLESGDPQAAFLAQAAARAIYAFGGAALACGLQRIFRPGRRWAKALLAGATLALVGSWLAWAASGQHSRVSGPTLANLGFDCARVIAFVWGAVESFAYFAAMRRRLRLGLAEPVITHQFLLWGISSSAMSGLLLWVVVARHVLERSPLEWPPSVAILASLGFLASTSIYTAFFPPRFWRRIVVALAKASG
jgi:hypothetical protein